MSKIYNCSEIIANLSEIKNLQSEFISKIPENSSDMTDVLFKEMELKSEHIEDKISELETELFSKETVEVEYVRKDNNNIEKIVFNFEAKLQEFILFYQKTGIDLPPDFENTVRDIWERNYDTIKSAIEENGFDGMLIIPGNIPLADLAEKMKMESGYIFYRVKEDFSDIKSQKVDKSRIILFHHMDSLPEIAQKTGLDIHLNITGADAEKLYQANPEDYFGTLEDSIILERKYFEDTGKHLSDYRNKSAQWLPGSRAGARLVYSYWSPGYRELDVIADGLESQRDSLGVRPSRCFF